MPFNIKRNAMLPTAARAITAAAMARPTSRPLTLLTAGAAGRGAGVGDGGRVAAGPVEVGGRVAVAGAPGALVAGRPAAGAGVAPAMGAAPAGVPAEGPAAGTEGSLIVGAEVGLGGRLMRTVSFLG